MRAASGTRVSGAMTASRNAGSVRPSDWYKRREQPAGGLEYAHMAAPLARVGGECRIEIALRSECARECKRVEQCHVRALAELWTCRVRGIADMRKATRIRQAQRVMAIFSDAELG